MLDIIKKWIANWYLNYELVTCVYMFEPWERKLINGFVLLIMGLILFSSYVYLPKYMETFIHFLSPSPILVGEMHAHSQKLPIS